MLRWLVASWTTQSLTIDIEQAVTQIYRVVNAVKKFTYMDNLADKEMVDVEPGIRDTLSILLGKTKSKNATITLEIDPDVPRVYANGSELNQVWFCLLDNALDAIPESGTICVESRCELNRVVIEIVDDGPGIAPRHRPHLFEPFYTTASDGSGMARHRITWTPNDDGTVRQVWNVSTDGGATWKVVFDGTYTRSGS